MEKFTGQLFIDADGVLCAFDQLAETILGMTGQEFEDLHGSDAFWGKLHEHGSFFEDLSPMDDADILWKAIEHLDPIILTGVPQKPNPQWAIPQKLKWSAQHRPAAKMITCPSKDKRLHMQPGDILVDDFLKYRHL